MPRLRVEMPTSIFKNVMARAARKEFKATRRFSARMSCNAGFTSEVAMALLSQFSEACFQNFGNWTEASITLFSRFYSQDSCVSYNELHTSDRFIVEWKGNISR